MSSVVLIAMLAVIFAAVVGLCLGIRAFRLSRPSMSARRSR